MGLVFQASLKFCEMDAKDFHITGDFNVDLGMIYTNEKDIEELDGMHGPLCWRVYNKNPGGFRK